MGRRWRGKDTAMGRLPKDQSIPRKILWHIQSEVQDPWKSRCYRRWGRNQRDACQKQELRPIADPPWVAKSIADERRRIEAWVLRNEPSNRPQKPAIIILKKMVSWNLILNTIPDLLMVYKSTVIYVKMQAIIPWGLHVRYQAKWCHRAATWSPIFSWRLSSFHSLCNKFAKKKLEITW